MSETGRRPAPRSRSHGSRRARSSRSKRSPTCSKGRIRPMRAETVIATHTNADFDAFASLLAVRRLYEGAVAALPGSLARNVREFYRLHADELDVTEVTRLDLGAIERLVVVETVHASRLGELEAVALDPAVEKVVFDHHAGDLPDWVAPENA